LDCSRTSKSTNECHEEESPNGNFTLKAEPPRASNRSELLGGTKSNEIELSLSMDYKVRVGFWTQFDLRHENNALEGRNEFDLANA
jgi:hypothetical protein